GQRDQARDELLNPDPAAEAGSHLDLAQSLGQVGIADPDLADTKVLTALLALAQQNNEKEAKTREAALGSIRLLLKKNPAVADSGLLSALLPLLEDNDSAVREAVLADLNQLVTIDPTLATSELMKTVAKSIQDKDQREASIRSQLLSEVVIQAPRLAPDLLPLLEVR